MFHRLHQHHLRQFIFVCCFIILIRDCFIICRCVLNGGHILLPRAFVLARVIQFLSSLVVAGVLQRCGFFVACAGVLLGVTVVLHGCVIVA
ncbi:MAG: hypothetical protein IPI55_16895 [Flavobacteriales bacterium]|nr:hypothetical protein [Flavobacteriales bacterium]